MTSRPRHPFFWIVLALGVLTTVSFLAAGAAVVKYGGSAIDFGWTWVAERDGIYVSTVTPGGAAEGALHPRDRIEGLDGDAVIGPQWYRRGAAGDRPYFVDLARGAERRRVELGVRRVLPASRWEVVLLCFVCAAWVTVGLFIGFSKPELPVARIACLCCVGLALAQLRRVLYPMSAMFSGAELVAYGALYLASPVNVALGYHAVSRFPPGAHPGRPWSTLLGVLYGLAALATITHSVPSALLYWVDPATARGLLFERFSLFAFGSRVQEVTQLMAGAGIIGVVTHNARMVGEVDERRRLRWAVYGALAGAAPMIVYIGTAAALRSLGQEYLWSIPPFRWMLPTVIVLGLFAPLTLGYVIVRHQVFDITVVIRSGLQYLLARNALRVILLLPLLGLLYTVASNPNRTIKELLFDSPGYLVLIAAAGFSLRFRRQVLDWLDRRFFREAYDRERILLRLLEDIDTLDSVSDIARFVSAQLDLALHPNGVYVWSREKENQELTLAYSSSAHVRTLDIPSGSYLVRAMEENPVAIEIPLERAGVEGASASRGFGGAAPGSREAERLWLERLGIQIVVPIVGMDQRLAGLLMLGGKKSEEPYSRSDREFLQAIAKQMAVVRDNLRLKDRVDEERQIRDAVVARFEGRQINLIKECPRCGACFDSSAAVCNADGHELTLSLPIERTIDGKYRLDRLIGRGGMGAVYEANDLRLERKVAIKIMLGRAFGNQVALRRFAREARASARLAHPNIVTVHDYGGIGREGAYLVMERLHGVTLRQELARAGVLPPANAADWFDQILEGVGAAHAQGIVHRDLKPENVLITRQGNRAHVTLLDFGLAKVRPLDTAATDSLSAGGVLLGTFGYMSPEQLAGGDVDERSDIFAIGVMVAEALVGRRPFDGRSYTEVLTAILHGSFHLSGDRPAVVRLDQVLQRCLAKERTQRISSVTALQKELIPAIRACPPLLTSPAAAGDVETIS